MGGWQCTSGFYVLFSLCRLRGILKFMLTSACVQRETSKELFRRVSPRNLYRGNKLCKLDRSHDSMLRIVVRSKRGKWARGDVQWTVFSQVTVVSGLRKQENKFAKNRDGLLKESIFLSIINVVLQSIP